MRHPPGVAISINYGDLRPQSHEAVRSLHEGHHDNAYYGSITTQNRPLGDMESDIHGYVTEASDNQALYSAVRYADSVPGVTLRYGSNTGRDGDKISAEVVALATNHVDSSLATLTLHSNNSDHLWELYPDTNSTSSHSPPFSLPNQAALGVLLSFFAFVTVLGNGMVILAVCRERYLRSATNYFMVSLAISDLIIGAVVMPFAISLEVSGQWWYFGPDWCDVWHSFDVLASTASILNLSVIALDRYWAITNPITYPSRMTHRRVLVLIALVWILSSAISFPAILWWRAVTKEHPPPNVCLFTDDIVYLIFSSIVSFYVPVLIILYAYYRIYRAASAQTKSINQGSKVMANSGGRGQTMTLRIHRGGRLQRIAREAVNYARRSSHRQAETPNGSRNDYTPCVQNERESTGSNESAAITPSRLVSSKWQRFAISRKLSKIAKEQKAAKTLGIVVGVFCVCWVPYFILNILLGICSTDCVKHADILFPVFTWLGYINSCMNPVIYACSMRDFRRAFFKTLCCCVPAYKLRYIRAHCYTPDMAVSSTSQVAFSTRNKENNLLQSSQSHKNGTSSSFRISQESMYSPMCTHHEYSPTGTHHDYSPTGTHHEYSPTGTHHEL